MKASELIERLAKYINDHGDCEIYTWAPGIMKHIPITNTHFIDDSYFDDELVDEDYCADFETIHHNIVID